VGSSWVADARESPWDRSLAVPPRGRFGPKAALCAAPASDARPARTPSAVAWAHLGQSSCGLIPPARRCKGCEVEHCNPPHRRSYWPLPRGDSAPRLARLSLHPAHCAVEDPVRQHSNPSLFLSPLRFTDPVAPQLFLRSTRWVASDHPRCPSRFRSQRAARHRTLALRTVSACRGRRRRSQARGGTRLPSRTSRSQPVRPYLREGSSGRAAGGLSAGQAPAAVSSWPRAARRLPVGCPRCLTRHWS
jgi:hypothetical protein